MNLTLFYIGDVHKFNIFFLTRIVFKGNLLWNLSEDTNQNFKNTTFLLLYLTALFSPEVAVPWVKFSLYVSGVSQCPAVPAWPAKDQVGCSHGWVGFPLRLSVAVCLPGWCPNGRATSVRHVSGRACWQLTLTSFPLIFSLLFKKEFF